MLKGWALALFLCAGLKTLHAEIELFPNPAQQFNTTENYCNRQLYFFIQKNFDGSIVLQVQPPPYYDEDADLLDSGIAQFDIDTVIQTYTAAEAAALGEVNITFTVTAIPNDEADTGYILQAELFQWLLNTHYQSAFFENMQSFNLIYYSEDDLVDVNINPDGGSSLIYFTVVDDNIWYSGQQSALLTDSLIDTAYYSTDTPNTTYSQDFTFRVNLTTISDESAPGDYSYYLVFQMEPLDPDITFLETMIAYGQVQQTQLNQLYDYILAIDGDLTFGSNQLYRPGAVEEAILNTNRTTTIAYFEDILNAMTVQWNGYAALKNLTTNERTVINEMLDFITLANTELAAF